MFVDSVQIDLSQDEALLLFEWLAELDGVDDLPIPERWILWKIEGKLESSVNVLFSQDYDGELRRARERLIELDQSGQNDTA